MKQSGTPCRRGTLSFLAMCQFAHNGMIMAVGGNAALGSVCDPISRMYNSSWMEVCKSVIVHFHLPLALAIFCFIFPGIFPSRIVVSRLPYESSVHPSAVRLQIWLSIAS